MSIDDDIERRIARDMARWQQGVSRPGAPTAIDDAWLQTPPGLRMGFAVLKSAGIPPREVELLAERAALRAQLDSSSEPAEQETLQRRLSELEQNIALRLETLRRLGAG